MHPDKVDKLNGIGVVFRYTTPFFNILFGIILTLIAANFNSFKQSFLERCDRIENNISDLKTDFKAHIKWGEDITAYYREEWKDLDTWRAKTDLQVKINTDKINARRTP